MSTIKSSTEHLTLNADGVGKEIKFQANGTQVASIDSTGKFIGDGSALTGIDAATVSATAPSSPAQGDMWFDTTTGTAAMKVWSGSAWDQMSNKFSATGGTESSYSSGGVNYKVHTFTSSGTFTAEASGSVDYLVVAGGGGGGGGYQSPGGGGGGAGGYLSGTLSVSAGSYGVTVGGGGAFGRGDGTHITQLAANGANSVFSTKTAIGGGRGGAYSNHSGLSGGSGGGESYGGGAGSGTSGQGNNGGSAATSSTQNAAGGGGAGGVGGSLTSIGGAGGVGLSSVIRTGSAIFYAGGGGGGAGFNSSSGGLAGGAGGNGGGGAGGASNSSGNCNGTSGSSNTGGGGGGAGGPVGSIDQTQQSGGSGGSGIVIVRYAV